MKNSNNGFIQIPLLIVIIVSTLLVSAGTGVVLHKNNKLPFVNNKNVVENAEEKEQEQLPEFTSTPSSAPVSESAIFSPTVLPKDTNQPTLTAPVSIATPTSQANTAISLTPTPITTSSPTPTPTPMPTPTTPAVQPTQAPTSIPTLIPQPTIYVNPGIEEKLAELRQTLDHISNQPVPMNVIYGRMGRAYQDWIKNNPEIYSAILGSRYINDLNAILRAYGL
ncbi:MAG: hypothetical protein HQ536_04075 [Parcubacteria group bacterium]|nr:hypothetical protein [Parcubacteria group bacterium]